MSNYGFEGDISRVSERQLEFINNIIIENGLKDDQTKILFEPVGKAGDNYTSTVKRIILEGETGKFSLIAKVAPTNEMARKYTNSFVMFNNEHIMYTEVLPKFTQLENAANVPEDQRLRYAKCYGSLSEQPNEVIILEDLGMSDFNMLDRFKPLSDTCVKSVLKNFAILHSLSYALKKRDPGIFDQVTVKFIDLWTATAEFEEAIMYFQQLENEVLSLLDNEEHKNIMRHKISEMLSIATKLAKADIGSKYSVIQQGDTWTNNIMFRMDDTKVESIMIDYQVSKESSPAYDLLYMIFNCTDCGSRSKNFYEWVNYYHEELDKCLSNFGLKANFVYSKDQLDADIKRYGKLAFSLSVVLASIFVRKSEDAIDVGLNENGLDLAQITESSKIALLDDATIKLFKDRVIGLVTSFTEFGFL